MAPVTNSSNVEAVHYDDQTNELHVQFKGGATYVYEGVPVALAGEVVASAPEEKVSTGKLVNQIKAGGYKFRRL